MRACPVLSASTAAARATMRASTLCGCVHSARLSLRLLLLVRVQQSEPFAAHSRPKESPPGVTEWQRGIVSQAVGFTVSLPTSGVRVPFMRPLVLAVILVSACGGETTTSAPPGNDSGPAICKRPAESCSTNLDCNQWSCTCSDGSGTQTGSTTARCDRGTCPSGEVSCADICLSPLTVKEAVDKGWNDTRCN